MVSIKIKRGEDHCKGCNDGTPNTSGRSKPYIGRCINADRSRSHLADCYNISKLL